MSRTIFTAKLDRDASMVIGITLGILPSLLFGLEKGLLFGVSVYSAFVLGYFKIILFLIAQLPFTLIPWLLIQLIQRRKPQNKNDLEETSLVHPFWLRYCPIIWDEVIWLRLVGLNDLLLVLYKQDRQQGIDAITNIKKTSFQNWIVRDTPIEFITIDIELADSIHGIAELSMKLKWTYSIVDQGFENLLVSIDEISKLAFKILKSEETDIRQSLLQKGTKLLANTKQALQIASTLYNTSRFLSAINNWENIFIELYEIAQEEGKIPNVYVAGMPLVTNSRIFKGRQDIFRTLKRELVTSARQRPAIILFGARRMGKTSILRQLPEKLGPQTIPIEIDMQSMALSENATSLFLKISDLITKGVANYRSIFDRLPFDKLENDPYRTFSDWMEGMGDFLEKISYWILLCFDEYEYFGKMLNDGRISERAFELLRTLIQNHSRLTLLFSGAHTPQDMDPIWSQHLINTRILKVDPLTEQDAYELIVRPTPDYPLQYEERAINHLLGETGCHPYLIQVTCRDLVHTLNDQDRSFATYDDVESALDSALFTGAAYFSDLWTGIDSSEIQRSILLTIALEENNLEITDLVRRLKTKPYKIDEIQKGARALINREILQLNANKIQFRFGLIRRWIKNQQFFL